jgi:hypothetical protein
MARVTLGRIGLENEEVTPEVTDETLNAMAEAPDQEIADATQIAAELDAIDGAIEEGVDTADTLGEVAAPLQEAVDSGEGIPAPAAESLRILVSHMTSRIGVPVRTKTFAMESFKGKQTRLQATQIALEGIKETAQRIWAQIVEAFNKAIDWIKSFFAKLFDGAVKLKAAGEKLSKAAGEKASATMEKDTIESAGFAEKLQVGGAAPAGDAFAAQFKSFVDSYKTYIGATEAASNRTFMDNVKQLFANATDGAKAKEKLKVLAHKITFGKKGQSAQTPPEGMEVQVLDLTKIGDKQISGFAFTAAATDEQVLANIGRVKVWVEDVAGRKAVDGKNVKALTASAAKEVADSVVTLAAALIDGKKAAAALETEQKNLQKLASDMSKKAPSMAGPAPEGGQTSSEAAPSVLAAAVRSSINLTTTALSQTRSYGLTTGNAALAYVSASLSLHKAAAAAAK